MLSCRGAWPTSIAAFCWRITRHIVAVLDDTPLQMGFIAHSEVIDFLVEPGVSKSVAWYSSN
jgi:hypothetical protein